MREEQLVFQGLKGRVIQLEFDLERSIGQPASLLEELDNLVERFVNSLQVISVFAPLR